MEFSRLTIKSVSGRAMDETAHTMRVMIQSGVDIAPVITHGTEFEWGCDAVERGTGGKEILHWR